LVSVLNIKNGKEIGKVPLNYVPKYIVTSRLGLTENLVRVPVLTDYAPTGS